MRELKEKTRFLPKQKPRKWRTGWDSNPRAGVTDKLISSQPRYDRFDTRPYIFYQSQSPAKMRELFEGTAKNNDIKFLRKPLYMAVFK